MSGGARDSLRSAGQDALRQLQHARSLYRELQLWNCHYSVELSMARLYLESEKPGQAQVSTCFHGFLTLSRGDPGRRGGRPRELFVACHGQALVLIQELGDLSAAQLCYGLLCQALLDAELDALPRCREALQRPGRRWRCRALELLAAVEADAAREALDEALKLSRELNDKDLEAGFQRISNDFK